MLALALWLASEGNMSSKEKGNLTTWEAACIITGYGIGSGVMSMPWLAQKCGFPLSVLILVVSFVASYVLHVMIADLALKSDGGQIITCLTKFLFRGKLKNVLSITFFVLMGIILCTNLGAYIYASEEIIVGLVPMPALLARVLFYAVCAVVVLFGLKAVGISEKYAVGAIFVLIAGLAVASVFAEHHAIPLACESLNSVLAYFGMAMFAMSAFFSVPQAVEGLKGDVPRIRKAVFLGLLNNFVLILVISVCALLASTEITEVAMVGWSEGIGDWARIIGGLFTILAMLTTYWSLSLALADIVKDMLHIGDRLSWFVATIPSFALVMFNLSGFMELMRTAGGLIAIIIAVMIVPAYRNAKKSVPGSALRIDSLALDIAIIVAYVVMAIGSIVPV